MFVFPTPQKSLHVKALIRVKWGHSHGACMMTFVPLWEEEGRPKLSPHALQGHSEKVAVCKPGGEPSPDAESAGPLILDGPASWENTYLMPPVQSIWLKQPTLAPPQAIASGILKHSQFPGWAMFSLNWMLHSPSSPFLHIAHRCLLMTPARIG